MSFLTITRGFGNTFGFMKYKSCLNLYKLRRHVMVLWSTCVRLCWAVFFVAGDIDKSPGLRQGESRIGNSFQIISQVGVWAKITGKSLISFSIKPASTSGIVLSFSCFDLKSVKHKSQDSCSKFSENYTKLFFCFLLNKNNKVPTKLSLSMVINIGKYN